MTKAKANRLKVFQAQFGFHDSVVAAPNQTAALRAWGTHQNLFADGQARVTSDEAAVKAALSHPETPLRRALGSDGAFELEPTSLPNVPDIPKRSAETSKEKVRDRPRPDRSRLDVAERALAGLDAERKQEERALQKRESDLDAEIAAARITYVARRKEARAAVVVARAAYRDSGGSD